MHLGRDRVIAAHEVRGVIVDPGPASCLDVLVSALEEEPRALLLTHIHLDHAGAAGSLVRRFPALRVFVHEAGAPHLVDPTKLLESAARLYGDELDRLWGEVVPVPAEAVTALSGGETLEGFRVAYTPGHASHHVCYLDEASGDAYVGDVAGVRIPPAVFTLPPTPPPDIDIDAWEESLDLVASFGPTRLRLTHFGEATDPQDQLDLVRERLRALARRAKRGDRGSFIAETDRELVAEVDPETAERFRQAVPLDHSWLGLERYWKRRGDTSRGGKRLP